MKSQKDILALGQEIVRQLKLDDHDTILERWLSHHLAEIMERVDLSNGKDKIEAEQQAIDIILKLWASRRSLPISADPLGGYRDAIAVLSRLNPTSNLWLHRDDPYENMLRDMFLMLSKIFVGGLLLTTMKSSRPMSKIESEVLETEESTLKEMLDYWTSMFAITDLDQKVKVSFIAHNSVDGTNDESTSIELDLLDQLLDEDVRSNDISIHALILANLRNMQSSLSSLINDWETGSRKDRIPDLEDKEKNG